MYIGQYGATKQSVWTEEHIEKYLPLVKRISGRIAMSLPPHIDQEDLVGYGVFGLLDALQRFEPSKGVKFETYATLRIRGAMIDGLRSMDWVPHSARQKVKRVQQGVAELEVILGRTASIDELAKHLEQTVEELNATILQGQFMTLVSMEDITTNDSTESNFIIVDQKAQEPFKQIEKDEQKQILMEAVEKLSEKEKTVVALYYREELTLKEIAYIMKLSESRISQIHSQAILRLRGYLGRQKKNIL